MKPLISMVASFLALSSFAFGSARADDATGGALPSATSTLTPVTGDVGSYPTRLVDRPLTLPAGMFQIGAQVANTHAAGNAQSLPIALSYGITNDWEVGVGSGFIINPDADWGRNIDVGTRYKLLDTTDLDVAASVLVPLTFRSGADNLNTIVVGPLTRYVLSDQFFVLGGADLLPVTINPSFALAANLAPALGFQATDQLAVLLGTNLIHLKLAGDSESTSIIFRDTIPVSVSGLYALSGMLDLLASFRVPDAKNFGDAWAVSVGANVRL